MLLVSKEELIENGVKYLIETFDNGSVVKRQDFTYTPSQQYVELPQETVTLDDLQAQIKELQVQSTTTGEQVAEMYAVQAGDVVVKSELDAAYREGVNAYAE